jgi:hypothetical protein
VIRSELTRSAPLTRTGPPARRTPLPSRRPSPDTTERAARALVSARSHGLCEAGDGVPAADWSHRVARSRLGAWRASNGVHLCRACHAWAHAEPDAARACGLIVATETDPALARVWLDPATAWPGWWILSDDGLYVAVDTDDPAPRWYPAYRREATA